MHSTLLKDILFISSETGTRISIFESGWANSNCRFDCFHSFSDERLGGIGWLVVEVGSVVSGFDTGRFCSGLLSSRSVFTSTGRVLNSSMVGWLVILAVYNVVSTISRRAGKSYGALN